MVVPIRTHTFQCGHENIIETTLSDMDSQESDTIERCADCGYVLDQ